MEDHQEYTDVITHLDSAVNVQVAHLIVCLKCNARVIVIKIHQQTNSNVTLYQANVCHVQLESLAVNQ